jgi:C4-type Zn-finger protein
MVECPRCKSEDVEVTKSWDVKPKSGRGKAIRVYMYLCKSCGHKFRKAVKLEEIEAGASTNTPKPITIASTLQTSPAISEQPKESFFDKLKKSLHL